MRSLQHKVGQLEAELRQVRLSLQEPKMITPEWVGERWDAEVGARPLTDIHRRTLDRMWRQVYRELTGVEIYRPTHDESLASSKSPGSSPRIAVDVLVATAEDVIRRELETAGLPGLPFDRPEVHVYFTVTRPDGCPHSYSLETCNEGARDYLGREFRELRSRALEQLTALRLAFGEEWSWRASCVSSPIFAVLDDTEKTSEPTGIVEAGLAHSAPTKITFEEREDG